MSAHHCDENTEEALECEGVVEPLGPPLQLHDVRSGLHRFLAFCKTTDSSSTMRQHVDSAAARM
jgi:hypothetical protein